MKRMIGPATSVSGRGGEEERRGDVLSRVSSSRHLLHRLHSFASCLSSASLSGSGEGVCMMAPWDQLGGGGVGVSERRGEGVVRERTAVRKRKKEDRKAGDSDSIVGGGGRRGSSRVHLPPPSPLHPFGFGFRGSGVQVYIACYARQRLDLEERPWSYGERTRSFRSDPPGGV